MSASPTAPRSSHCAQLHYLPRCDTIRSPKHDYLGRHRALTIVAPTLTIVEIRSLLLGTFVDDKRADELMMCVCAICSIGDRRKCVWRWYWIIRRCACLFFVCGKPRVATRNTPPAPGWVLGALAIGPSTPGFSNSRIRAPPHVHPRSPGSRPSSLRGPNEEFYKKKLKTKKLRLLED